MTVLFVCSGNTCRSPMAEGYLNSKKLSGLSALSAGFISEGDSVSLNSEQVMKEIGIDISSHKSKIITPDMLNADRIFCMGESHKSALLSAGVNPEKLFVLGGGIPDPFGQDIQVYRECRDKIISAVNLALYSGEILPLKVFSADENDADAVAELEKECFSTPWSKNAINESLKCGTRFFKAEKDGRLAGYISVTAVCGEGYINNVAVTEKLRKGGIGSLLLDRAVTFAQEISLEFLSLEVRASNLSAISLYENRGFVKEGLRRGFYENPKEDGIIMTRRFKR